MSEMDLVLVNETDNCTVYTIQFTSEDDTLQGYVITLQNFEKLLKEGQENGLVTITEKTIEIKKASENNKDSTDEDDKE